MRETGKAATKPAKQDLKTTSKDVSKNVKEIATALSKPNRAAIDVDRLLKSMIPKTTKTGEMESNALIFSPNTDHTLTLPWYGDILGKSRSKPTKNHRKARNKFTKIGTSIVTTKPCAKAKNDVSLSV
jgi:hypothetical protein